MADKEYDSEIIRCAGIRWHLARGASDVLSRDVLDLAAHEESGNAQLVKNGPHRTVYRVSLPHGVVFWKRCRIAGLRSWLRQCIRPPKARMEYDRAVSLAARGIATFEPLAWGIQERAFAGESFLITREIAGAASLSAYLERIDAQRYEPRLRRAAAEALGRFLAQLHNAGIVHPDLHAGNMLVVDDAGTPRFHLIDLHDIRIGKPLGWPARRDNLVVFNRWFVTSASRADRCRFWRAYRTAGDDGAGFPENAARDLESRTCKSNFVFRCGRDRRCMGSNRYYQKVRSPVVAGHAVREMDGQLLQQLLEDPARPFADPARIILKDSRTSTVAEIQVNTADGPRPMIWKRFQAKKPFTSLLNRLRTSPALRSWQTGYAFWNRRLPTPRPWLVLHRRTTLGPGEGYLLCEKVTDAIDLLRALESMRTPEEKWDNIAALARLIREMHDLGLSHRDLKAANILWRPATASFHFIDLVGAARHRQLPISAKVRNLARLQVSFAHDSHLTRTDRLRFLSIYLCWALRGSAGWKTWWRKIAEASREKIEKNRQRGRTVA
jgi:tRNA A-37 threonylcarbamoyl transferase component Bud32